MADCPVCLKARKSSDWYAARKRVLDRDGYRCRICGGAAEIVVHHARPLHFGGEAFADWNLVSLCRVCHSEQDAYACREWADWRAVHHWDVAALVPPRRARLSSRQVARLLPVAQRKQARAQEFRRGGKTFAAIAAALDYPRADFVRDCCFTALDDYDFVVRSFHRPEDVAWSLAFRRRARKLEFVLASSVEPRSLFTRPLRPVNG